MLESFTEQTGELERLLVEGLRQTALRLRVNHLKVQLRLWISLNSLYFIYSCRCLWLIQFGFIYMAPNQTIHHVKALNRESLSLGETQQFRNRQEEQLQSIDSLVMIKVLIIFILTGVIILFINNFAETKTVGKIDNNVDVL